MTCVLRRQLRRQVAVERPDLREFGLPLTPLTSMFISIIVRQIPPHNVGIVLLPHPVGAMRIRPFKPTIRLRITFAWSSRGGNPSKSVNFESKDSGSGLQNCV